VGNQTDPATTNPRTGDLRRSCWARSVRQRSWNAAVSSSSPFASRSSADENSVCRSTGVRGTPRRRHIRQQTVAFADLIDLDRAAIMRPDRVTARNWTRFKGHAPAHTGAARRKREEDMDRSRSNRRGCQASSGSVSLSQRWPSEIQSCRSRQVRRASAQNRPSKPPEPPEGTNICRFAGDTQPISAESLTGQSFADGSSLTPGWKGQGFLSSARMVWTSFSRRRRIQHRFGTGCSEEVTVASWNTTARCGSIEMPAS